MRRHRRRRRLLRHGVPLSLPKCAAVAFSLDSAASRTRATTVRHRRDCFLEWKLRLLPLLHSVVLAAARRCSLGAMILRGQTVVVVVTVSLVAVDFLFWTPESERASEQANSSRPSIHGPIIALHSAFASSLSRRSPQSSAAYQLVHDYCNRAVKDQLDGRPRLKTLTIFSSF